MSLKEVKELLNINDTNFKKKFGQNFLIDDNILKKISESLVLTSNVLEIGPGLGSLTKYLLENYDKVLAYEIDSDMIEILEKRFDDRLVIKNIDFLKANIDEDIYMFNGDKAIDLVANIPYYITTPILLKILEESNYINNMVLMVQKEVAERLLGKVKTKEYNSLSVLIQTYMNVEKVCSVSKESFYPIPDVDSMVIKLTRREVPYDIYNDKTFKKVNRLLFRFRRKTIYNNLKDIYNKDFLLKMFNDLDISSTKRSEELTVEQIISIANYIEVSNDKSIC